MLAIKLKIIGRKNQRTFRVIVQETRTKLGGKNVEDLGWYNPHTNQFKIDKARADYWISNGAQPTDSVATLLKKVENSEVGSYETREGRKKNKGPKAEAIEGGEPKPEAPVEGEAPEEVTAEETPTEEEVPPKSDDTTGQAVEEKKEEAPAEEPKEEAKADESSPSDAPEEAFKEEPVEEQKEGE